jgi:hypothetical protein
VAKSPNRDADAFSAWLGLQPGDHRTREVDPLSRHATLCKRKADPTGTDAEFERRSRAGEPGEELNGGLDVLARGLLAAFKAVVCGSHTLVEVPVPVHDPNLPRHGTSSFGKPTGSGREHRSRVSSGELGRSTGDREPRNVTRIGGDPTEPLPGHDGDGNDPCGVERHRAAGHRRVRGSIAPRVPEPNLNLAVLLPHAREDRIAADLEQAPLFRE